MEREKGIKIFYVFSIDYQLISHRKAVVKAAIANGYDVTVIAQDTGYRKEIEQMGIKFINLPINRVGTNLREEIRTFLFLYKLYSKERPDIVHHVSLKIVLWGGLAARLAKIHGVVNAVNGLGVLFQDGTADSRMKRGILKVMRFSNNRQNIVTILQNDDDKDFFLTYRAIKPKQVRIIHGSGVDLNEFCYTKPISTEPIKIVFTSRMVEEKGVKDIIEAAKLLRVKYEGKITFWMCGLLESNPKAISKDYINRECDGKYIVYKGFCKNVKDILQDSDIVILPSYYREGIPKSLIEATAIGRPIITTDWTGCKETVRDGENGWLIPIKSPKILADKLESLIVDAGLRERMGKASRKLAESAFSIDYVIKRHLEIYKEF